MIAGSIILLDFVQSNGVVKKRPALVVAILPRFSDLLLAGISTQLHQAIPQVDIELLDGQPGFRDSGLKRSSIVRLTLLSRIERKDPSIFGTIGTLDPALLIRAKRNLADLILRA